MLSGFPTASYYFINHDEYRAVVGYLPQNFDAYKNFKAKETIMIKDGKVLLQGVHKEILKDTEIDGFGKVHSNNIELFFEIW
ncbi:hypothetical protein [Romboutsia sp.]|uniref:hypothetical protein n=1 Tax=Romboutsia sp. TaxID=1965302 RepID=UPI003F2E2FD0